MTPTPRIISTISDLNAFRGLQIVSLLHGIADRGKKITPNNRSIGGRAFVIAISDTTETGNDFSSWRFKTYIDGFHAMYHEIWIPFQGNEYFLERAYFHIYKTKLAKLEEEEYILLHCDASEPEESPHSRYKQSPHLHIKSAEQPLPHAHFALNNCDLEVTLSSIDSLHKALQNAIDMIDHQVFLVLAQ